jgi:hypothetical protein
VRPVRPRNPLPSPLPGELATALEALARALAELEIADIAAYCRWAAGLLTDHRTGRAAALAGVRDVLRHLEGGFEMARTSGMDVPFLLAQRAENAKDLFARVLAELDVRPAEQRPRPRLPTAGARAQGHHHAMRLGAIALGPDELQRALRDQAARRRNRGAS